MQFVLSRFLLAFLSVFACQSAFAVTVHGGTGVGAFQDIQVPYNETYEMRGDGTAVQEENIGHSGLLLQAGLGKESQRGRWLWQVIDFDAMQIKSSGGPAATQAASYTRLNFQSAMTYRFAVGDMLGSTGLKAGVRRSSFNNVSSSHYIESVMVGLTAGLTGQAHAFEGSLAVAPVARFGYSEDGMFGGKEFKNSKATLFEASAQYSYVLREGVWLDLGLGQETAHVQIGDVNEYNDLGYGLSVEDSTRPTRTYDLTTVAARLGVRKIF